MSIYILTLTKVQNKRSFVGNKQPTHVTNIVRSLFFSQELLLGHFLTLYGLFSLEGFGKAVNEPMAG